MPIKKKDKDKVREAGASGGCALCWFHGVGGRSRVSMCVWEEPGTVVHTLSC